MASTDRDIIFYDGDCGLCHHWVRKILHADLEGQYFVFAARQSQAFDDRFSDDLQKQLPDSVVVYQPDGTWLVRSRAAAYICETLGGRFRPWAMLLRCTPRSVADMGYRLIASIRHRLYARPAGACPLVPPEQRSRFLN